MTAPNMAAITASLERSLQSFSLNHQHHQHHHNHNSNSNSNSSSGSSGRGGEGSGGNFSRSAAADIGGCQLQSATSSDATLELNSNITLPYHWEQCLDLKTGEVYYINWRTGMKSKEDPRSTGVDDGYFYSDDEDEDDEEYDESSDQGSSVESSSRKEEEEEEEEEKQEDGSSSRRIGEGGGDEKQHVLVVAGCKGCFMYFMVPKQVEDCPKCCGQLLHFDRSDDNAA